MLKRIVTTLLLVLAPSLALANLPAPTNFHCDPVANAPGAIQCDWNDVAGRASYTLFVDDWPVAKGILPSASAPGTGAKMFPGYSYKYEVAAFDSAGVMGEKSTPIFLYGAPYNVVGTKRVLVALVDWTDWTPPWTAASIQPFFNDIAQWVADESDGLANVEFTILDWREIPVTLQSLYDSSTNAQKFIGTDGTYYGISQKVYPAMAPYFPEVSSYDYTAYIVNGSGEVGLGLYYSAQHSMTKGTHLHEMGHVLFGLMHTGGIGSVGGEPNPMWQYLTEPDASRWFFCRYCSQYDPMGAVITLEGYSETNPPPMSYSAYKKVRIGWAPYSSLQFVPLTGGSYQLNPTEEPTRPGSIAAMYPLGSAKAMFYEVSWHEAINRVFVRVLVPINGGYIWTPPGGAPQQGWGDDDLYEIRANGFGVSQAQLSPGSTYHDTWRGINVYFEGVFAGANGNVAVVTITTPTTPVGGNPHPKYYDEEGSN